MIGRVTETLSKVKDSLGSNERHALPGVIGDDLLHEIEDEHPVQGQRYYRVKGVTP